MDKTFYACHILKSSVNTRQSILWMRSSRRRKKKRNGKHYNESIKIVTDTNILYVRSEAIVIYAAISVFIGVFLYWQSVVNWTYIYIIYIVLHLFVAIVGMSVVIVVCMPVPLNLLVFLPTLFREIKRHSKCVYKHVFCACMYYDKIEHTT